MSKKRRVSHGGFYAKRGGGVPLVTAAFGLQPKPFIGKPHTFVASLGKPRKARKPRKVAKK